MGFAWHRTDEVLAAAGAFARRRSHSDAQWRLLATALQGLRIHADAFARPPAAIPPPFIHLPLLVYAAQRGDDSAAIPLAATTALIFLGLDIHDDLADGDRPEHWRDCSDAEIGLAAAMLLSALPQLGIASLDAPPSVRDAMQGTLAEGLMRMAAGQQHDLASSGTNVVRADDVQRAVEAKSGEELAMFAALAAQFAQASEDVVAAAADFGRAVGTAGQLSSDCYELFSDPAGRDFAHGAQTLPIALQLERLAKGERTAFLELLARARHDEGARESVRQRLRGAGDLRRCAFIVEVHCQRALRAVERMATREPGRAGLIAFARGISFFAR